MKKGEFKLGKIIGKKIVAIKDYRQDYTDIALKEPVKPGYILFDDKKTYLMLCEQDHHDYHDCNEYAREITLVEDPVAWAEIMADSKHFPDADTDIED